MAHLNGHLAPLRDDPEFKEIVEQAVVGATRMRKLLAARLVRSEGPTG
jgi:hypothetical protein